MTASTRIPLRSGDTHISSQTRWGSRDLHPGERVAPTAPKRFVIPFILLCQVKGWTPLCFHHSEWGMENSALFGKRSFGIRKTCPNQRSFWCWTHSSMEVPVTQPKTRFLTASLMIHRHHSTRDMILRQRFHQIITIIDSMTSVFNTDASLPYNHDSFESLIVKKRTFTQAIWIGTDNKMTTDIGWQPYLVVSSIRHTVPILKGE
ncbi:hypothetical protein T265_04693 [Opisthorchis viverrini]|uniref:Uncharacterized protein n=1 Tax=Opisthorchis viverrini TaxID=6198 RepID=A0A075AG74_OPIVI|nr:hypothetical protein T265_04693 [Opisthorchis viverrini]KER28464.1 hypothetical protein T265_04693 [Opisthorchis viverrini]